MDPSLEQTMNQTERMKRIHVSRIEERLTFLDPSFTISQIIPSSMLDQQNNDFGNANLAAILNLRWCIELSKDPHDTVRRIQQEMDNTCSCTMRTDDARKVRDDLLKGLKITDDVLPIYAHALETQRSQFTTVRDLRNTVTVEATNAQKKKWKPNRYLRKTELFKASGGMEPPQHPLAPAIDSEVRSIVPTGLPRNTRPPNREMIWSNVGPATILDDRRYEISKERDEFGGATKMAGYIEALMGFPTIPVMRDDEGELRLPETLHGGQLEQLVRFYGLPNTAEDRESLQYHLMKLSREVVMDVGEALAHMQSVDGNNVTNVFNPVTRKPGFRLFISLPKMGRLDYVAGRVICVGQVLRWVSGYDVDGARWAESNDGLKELQKSVDQSADEMGTIEATATFLMEQLEELKCFKTYEAFAHAQEENGKMKLHRTGGSYLQPWKLRVTRQVDSWRKILQDHYSPYLNAKGRVQYIREHRHHPHVGKAVLIFLCAGAAPEDQSVAQGDINIALWDSLQGPVVMRFRWEGGVYERQEGGKSSLVAITAVGRREEEFLLLDPEAPQREYVGSEYLARGTTMKPVMAVFKRVE